MRHFYAGMLALACVGAQAATYELTLTNPTLSVIDLTPGDQFMPGYTVDTGNVADLLTPSYTSAKGMFFETNTILPPSTGPDSGHIMGTLGRGTQLIWTANAHLKISAIDTNGLWDWDGVSVQTTFYSSDIGSYSYLELNTGVYTGGGTYQRITQEQDFSIEIHATNSTDSLRNFQIGWFNQYMFSSYIDPFSPVTAVPEPETYALLLAGLGIVGAAARRRKANQSTNS